ncbi:MAG TPA: ABC transporter ATP-binding protein, partial [Kofleriaceae bacterium]|nr:ABC transporter ATP-binding protein [Kofleriaceae bacterium]
PPAGPGATRPPPVAGGPAPAAPPGEAVLGKAYDLRLMRQLWRFVRPNRGLIIAAACLIPLALTFELAQPYLLKKAVVDHIAIGRTEGLGALVLAFLGLILLQGVATFFQEWSIQLLGQRSMHALRLAIYDHVVAQRAAFFDRMPVGRLLTRMTNDIESINEMFASGVVTLFADFVKMCAIAAIMLYLDRTLTLFTFATFPFLIVLVNYARRAMRTSFRAIRVRLAAMNAFVQEHLSGVKVVQVFRREDAAAKEYDLINAGHRDAYLVSIQADAAMYALVEAIGVIAIAGVAWWASHELHASAQTVATVGLVVVFIEYINKFFIPIRDLSAKYAVMQGAMAATERIVELLDTHEPDAPAFDAGRASAGPAVGAKSDHTTATAAAAASAGEQAGAAAAPEVSGALVGFHDVHFSYGAEPVLRGVSLEVPQGKTIAIVGATGSGKSTLIKLLTRLYEIGEGRITLGGVDIRELPVGELRRRVTVVSQDVALFAGSIYDNVALGAVAAGRTATRDEVADALRRVGFDRLLARRGGGLDAPIGDRGGNFSAGERQLLAFARALIRDPEILILDEATAHVDPEAEELIERGVDELMRGRTTLVIAHRLSTIRHAHQILVFDRGTIVERGTHDELVAKGGVYATLERTFRRAGGPSA